MADRIITAEAIITAKDATGDVFTKIAGKFQQLGKGAKVSADIEKMSKTIEQANSQLRALDKLQSTRTGFAEARTKFQAQKTAVEQAAKAMRDAEKPTRALQAAYQRAQTEVTKAAAAFERSKTAMLDAKHAAEAFGTPLARVAAEQGRLKSVIDSTTKAIEHQANAEVRAAENAAKMAKAHAVAEKAAERRAEGIRHHGIVNYALGAAAGYVGAHSVMSGVEKTLHAGAEYKHEIVGLQNAGRTPAEIAAIQRRSSEVVDRLPTATYLENMKVIAETTQAFGSVEHAMDHLEFMQKAMSVLKASGGEHIKGGPGDVGRALAKTFEERFTKAENFEKEAGAMIPAMVASGGVFNPEQLYSFAQQAKSSLPNYSMRFLSRIAPSLIGAQGGDRAGTAANAFTSIIMGKVNDKKQAEEWERYGLLDDSMVIKKSGNVVSWRSGAVKDTNLALSDPLEWAEKVALPAMAAKGVKIQDRMELTKALGTMFRNQNGNMFANEIMQADSRARLHKDENLINQVGSTDDIYHRNLTADPHVGLAAFNASLENLMTTVSGPAMGTIASGLSGLASGIDTLANALKDHPMLAMAAGATAGAAALGGAGWASYSMLNGFGLGASATALDGSAAALTEAAVALGARDLPGRLPGAGAPGSVGTGKPGELGTPGAGESGGFRPNAPIPPESAIPKSRLLGPGGWKGVGTTLSEGIIGAVIYEAGTRGITAALNALPHPNYPAGYDPQGIRNGGISGTIDRLRHDFTIDRPSDPWLSGERQAIERRSALAADAFRRDPEAARGFHMMEAHPALAGPSGPITAKVESPVPVDVTGKVQLEGQGNVSVLVKVEGPGTVTGQYASSSGHIRVSTGASMPGAKVATNGRVAGPN